MKEPQQPRQVGSREEGAPPDTYPRLTGQSAPGNKQPRVARVRGGAVQLAAAVWRGPGLRYVTVMSLAPMTWSNISPMGTKPRAR